MNAIILQIIGSILFAVGIGMMWLPAGVTVTGIILVLFGLASER